MTAASEKISEQALRDCIVTHPRSSFERIHNAAIDELLSLRAEHEEMRKALLMARNVISVACGEKAPFARIALDAIDAAQGAARGRG